MFRPKFAFLRSLSLGMAGAALVFGVAAAQSPTPSGGAAQPTLLNVSVAKNGIPAELGYRLRQGWTWQTAYHTVDPNLYYFLHWEEFVRHNLIRRSGAVRALAAAPNAALGAVKARSSLGESTLDELLANPKSRLQAFIVVHNGKIVFEKYPGMRAEDHHIWNSISKSVAGLLVGLLEAEGKIDVNKSIDSYVTELKGTQWQGIRVIDIMDMATGLDLVENEKARNDLNADFNRFWRLEHAATEGLGGRTSDQVLFGVKKLSEPGKVFEYSSMNTKMLGILAERASGQRVAELFTERVWSKIGAEGDAQVGVNPWGGAAIYGMVSTRLRDLARYGLIYTPSWKVVTAQPIVPASLIEKIQKTCRPELYAASNRGQRASADGAREERANSDGPRCNSRQWDAVWADGDFYKGGARGQGLYISPSRDVVVGWYSTTSEGGTQNFARAVAKALGTAQPAS